jgi:hypothetical protein
MNDRCKRCRQLAIPANVSRCTYKICALTLLLSGPERFRRKYQADLVEWLTPDLLYHAFTGEDDDYELARIARLDHVLLTALLDKVEKQWPARLEQIAKARRDEKEESKQVVQQFIINFNT